MGGCCFSHLSISARNCSGGRFCALNSKEYSIYPASTTPPSGTRKRGKKFTITNPPVLAIPLISSSVRLRRDGQMALTEEWEAMTGALLTFRASRTVSSEECDTSTSIPILFMAFITFFPKEASPPCKGRS